MADDLSWEEAGMIGFRIRVESAPSGSLLEQLHLVPLGGEMVGATQPGHASANHTDAHGRSSPPNRATGRRTPSP